MKVPTGNTFDSRLPGDDPLSPCGLISDYLRLNDLYLKRVEVVLLVVLETQLVVKAEPPPINLGNLFIRKGEAMPAARIHILNLDFVFDEPSDGCGGV